MLNHDNIVSCMGFVQRSGMEPYLVTLFEKGGNLQTHIERVGPLSPRIASGVLRQILLALDVAHQRGVVHRDLKPDNVLLRLQTTAVEIPHIRLTDFGIAKISGGLSSQLTQSGSFVGTPEYAAPEQFQGKGATAATDVFATGGLLLFLLTGSPPFQFEKRTDIAASFEQMVAGLPPVLDPEKIAGSLDEVMVLQEIIDHTMVLDADERWTVHQIIAQLNRLLQGKARSADQRTLEITDQPAPDRGRAPILAPAATFTVEATREEDRPVVPQEPPDVATTVEQKRPTSPPPLIRQQPVESQTPVPAQRSGRGGILGVLFGGVASMFMVLVVGTGVSVASLVLGAWFLGWMGADSTPLASLSPLTIDLQLSADLNRAAVLLGAESDAERQARADMTSALDGASKAMGRACKSQGPVAATLLVRANGDIDLAELDAGYLSATATECVRQHILGLKLDNALGRPALLRTAFSVAQ